VPTGKRILSKKGKDYKENTIKLVKEQIKNQKWDYELTKTKFVYLDYIAYMNRKHRDTDNLHKLLQDTLKELIYDDDTMVLTRPNRVMIDRNNPRLEIEFSFVEWTGIFANEEDMKKYIERCQSCKRFRKGSCSILKDSLDGVINVDVINELCNKYKNNIKDK
jgi:Holliday junction resolvase RusA-like endonuclease